MKNIFKFMGVALLACSMIMVSCKKDDENNEGQGGSTGLSGMTVKWGGENQTIGFKDAYKYSANGTVFILEAAKGLENEEYVFPMFRFGFDLDTDPEYGCALTAQWIYNQQYPGNMLWPTDVFVETYYTSQYSYNQVVGDWQLDNYTEERSWAIENAQYDATNLTLSCSLTLPMYKYSDLYEYIQNIGEGYTEDDVIDGVNNAEKKNVVLNLSNFKFDAASE